MNKVVSINEIEQAFDQLLQTINLVEETIVSQTEIEINEMKIAQLEKIVYLNSRLSQANTTGELSYRSTFRLAMGR